MGSAWRGRRRWWAYPATVVVPETASLAKVEALQHSGAQLIQFGATYDDAELEGRRLAGERGLWFVSAYNDAAVVAGGGTIALEVLEDLGPHVPGPRRRGRAHRRHRRGGARGGSEHRRPGCAVGRLAGAARGAGRRARWSTSRCARRLADGLAGNVE